MPDRCLALLLAFGAALAAAPAAAQESLTCTVQRVTDGDSIRCGGERVRLLLIDAPEMNQGPFGRAAQAFLEAVLPVGATARLVFDIDRRDRYGRLLAYVHRHDGRMVNALMTRRGFAVPLVIPPNVRHVEVIRAAADSARAAGIGLWSIQAFECEPEDHRAGRCEGVEAEPTGLEQRAQPATSERMEGRCDSSYPDVCIPPPPPDLDCRDVAARRFRVQGANPHRFDGNHAAKGCGKTRPLVVAVTRDDLEDLPNRRRKPRPRQPKEEVKKAAQRFNTAGAVSGYYSTCTVIATS